MIYLGQCWFRTDRVKGDEILSSRLHRQNTFAVRNKALKCIPKHKLDKIRKKPYTSYFLFFENLYYYLSWMLLLPTLLILKNKNLFKGNVVVFI